MSTGYYYFCHCGWPFEGREASTDAWADGVEHYNSTSHEGGEVKYFDGTDYVEVDEQGNPTESHHHTHHHHHHHQSHDEPHIF